MKVIVPVSWLVITVLSAPAYSQTSTVLVIPKVPQPEMTKGPAPISEVPALQPAASKFIQDLHANVYRNWKHGDSAVLKSAKVSFKIRPDGTFENIVLSRSSGNSETDFACVDAVRKSEGLQKKVPQEISDAPLIEFNFSEDFKRVGRSTAPLFRRSID